MGFVDRMVQNVAKYRIRIPMEKLWWAPFLWMVDVALQNAWILHRVNKEDFDSSYSLLAFPREVINTIFLKYSFENPSKRKISHIAIKDVPSDVQC